LKNALGKLFFPMKANSKVPFFGGGIFDVE
jgi:hypothetical protein